jgi:hypothetical protein
MKKLLIPVIVFFLVAAACSIQTATGNTTDNTIPNGNDSNPPVDAITSTFTPTSTVTITPTITTTPIPCNQATFSDATIDVTIPDYTLMTPGQAFTKTWRIRNIGTCSWNSSYQLIFVGDSPMGVGAGYAQPLTLGTVATGQEVDMSVALTAPMANGTYSGKWNVKAPGGEVFGISPDHGPFYVKIKVATPHTVTLTPRLAESGAVRSNGTTTTTLGAGESTTYPGTIAELFLSYDITGIPNNAIITEVKTDFHTYTLLGNPFSLGVLNVYTDDYGLTLDASDYVPGYPGGNIADYGSAAALNVIEAQPQLVTLLQSKLAGGGRLQLRLQFPGANGDIVTDNVIFSNPSLIISYLAP